MSDDPRVLFFGDQLIAGVGDTAGIGVVGRVTAECHARGLPIVPYNLGVAGETSVQTTLRFAAEALPRLAPGVDGRLVLCASANDTSAPDGRERLPTPASLRALGQALDHAAALHLPTLVLGPPPSGHRAHDKRTKALSTGIAKTCTARKVRFLDLYTPLSARPAWARAIAAGGHPTASAYDLLATTAMAGGLFAWLRDAPTA